MPKAMQTVLFMPVTSAVQLAVGIREPHSVERLAYVFVVFVFSIVSLHGYEFLKKKDPQTSPKLSQTSIITLNHHSIALYHMNKYMYNVYV